MSDLRKLAQELAAEGNTADIESALRAARAEALEDAVLAVCDECCAGAPVVEQDGESGHLFRGVPGMWNRCEASSLRRMAREAREG